MRLHCISMAGLALSIPSIAAAQAQVWVVDDQPGPGVDFTDLQVAIDSASEGDVLLLHSGTYVSPLSGFQVFGKSLTLVEDTGETAWIDGGLAAAHLAAGQSVLVRGIDAATTPASGVPPLILSDNQGSAWVEDGMYRSASSTQTTYSAGVLYSAASFLVGCRFTTGATTEKKQSGEAGIGLLDAEVAMFACVATGGAAGPQDHGIAGVGGYGLQVPGPGCFLAASSCEFFGGLGGSADSCDVAPPGDGGCGLFIYAPTFTDLAFLYASGLHGGPGGIGGGGACTGASGPPSYAYPPEALSETPGADKGLRANAPVREGELLVLEFAGTPGDLAVVAAASAPSHAVALLNPTGALAIASPWLVSLAGAVPASGLLTLALPVGELGPGVEATPVYLQSFFVDAAGGITVGTPSATVLLDSAF